MDSGTPPSSYDYPYYDNVNGSASYDYVDYCAIMTDTAHFHIKVLIPLCCVGFLGNVVSFFVWLGDRRKGTTTLLFMYLAVSDTLFLIFVPLVYWSSSLIACAKLQRTTLLYIFWVTQLWLTISVHTTMVIAITRWYAIWKPLKAHAVMTHRRVGVISGVTSFWSVVLVAVILVAEATLGVRGRMEEVKDIVIAVVMVGQTLPVLILLVSSISLVWITVRYQFFIQKTLHNGDEPAAYKQRRLTTAVLCIAGCTFVAFPLGVVAKVILVVGQVQGPDWVCDDTCRFFTDYVVDVLQCINCSINIVFYLIFCAKFRKLLKQRLACLSPCLRKPTPELSSQPTIESRHMLCTSVPKDLHVEHEKPQHQ